MVNKKEIQKLYFSLTNFEAQTIERLRLGYTNYTYLINNKHVLRFKRKVVDSFYDSFLESKIIKAIENLKISEKVIYFDQKKGIKLSNYIPKTKKIITLPTNKQLKFVASTLKKLHQAKIETGVSFDVVKRLLYYKSQCSDFVDKNYETQVIKQAERIYSLYPSVLCHNDVVRGNLLFRPNKVYLIDFEYASDNIPLFDLASFLSENTIEDELTRKAFLKFYFKRKCDEKIYYHLLKIIELQDILWYYWAQMYYIKTKDETYKKITHLKWQAILKNKTLNK
ncbi:MAG: choline kinase family protein [Bacilli bacterium]|jgi:thiamine kinase-like enzyme|nr:phosphotransferase [Erysipelotrichia bacterium]